MNEVSSPAWGRGCRRALTALALTVGAAACAQVAPASAEVPGPPSFATAVNLDSSSAGNAAVAVGDFNHDGRPDIATAIRTEGLGVLLSTGGGAYGPVAKYPAPDSFFGDQKFIVSMIAADLNGDGNLDLISQDARGDAIDIVWLGDGHGGFATGTAVALNARPGCGGSSDNPCQAAFPLDPQVGDFNEDGKLDIATPAANTNNVAVVLGNGDGTFAAPAYFPAGHFPITAASADVNHDGHVDLLTVQAGSLTGLVSLLLGDGHGSFSAPISFSPGIVVGGHAKFADLNEDGNVDLVVSNGAFEGKASIMLGHGDGTFATPALLDTGQNPSSLDLADLNGDGHLDLVSGLSNDGAIAVWVGDGHGAFAPPVTYDLDGASRPFGAAVADLDGDGLLDVVTANSDGDTNKDVSILINTTTVSASLGSQLDARIPAYVAIEGGSGSFGDVTPRFEATQYLADTTLKIATTSPSGVKVSVVAGDPSNLNLGGLGAVDVLADVDVTDDDYLSAWFPFASPVPLYLSRGPVNTSLRTLFRLQVPANKVLRRGDVYSEPITYTATSSVP